MSDRRYIVVPSRTRKWVRARSEWTWNSALRIGVGAALLAGVFGASTALAVQVQLESVTSVSGSTFSANARFVGSAGALVDDTTVQHLVNIADCKAITKQNSDEGNARVKVTWSWTDGGLLAALSGPKYAVKIAPPGGACDSSTVDKTDPGDSSCIVPKFSQSFADPTNPKGETFELDLAAMLGKAKCDGAIDDKAVVYFIVRYKDLQSNVDTTQSVAMNVDLDLTVPLPPTISSISGGNQNVRLAWTHADSSITLSRVHWSELPFDASAPDLAGKHSAVMTATSFQIGELVNEQTYYVAITALDTAQNESSAKEVKEARPVPVQDLWQYYKASGGASEGGFYPGCQASRTGDFGGFAVFLLVAGALLAIRLRRKWLLTVVAATVGFATLFGAQDASAVSPRTASLDIRFGYYLPAIDSEFADNGTGKTPYGDVMKESALHKGITVDWLLVDGFGELSMGFGAGWWEQTGTGKSYDGSSTEDKTTLTVFPFTVDLSYRFTVLAEKFNFPLVPYGRVGAAYGVWWVTNGLDEVAQFTAEDGTLSKAQGGVAGLHWSVGMRLLLDVFEPQAARGFDMELGVNHSYLFAEFQRLSLNNFGGDKKAFDLSDDIFHVGLAFDL